MGVPVPKPVPTLTVAVEEEEEDSVGVEDTTPSAADSMAWLRSADTLPSSAAAFPLPLTRG